MEKHKILIAEDDPYLAKLLGNFMAEEGVDISIAENGQVAIDLLKENEYRLALLDINMPYKTGFDVLAEMKKMKKAPPAIVFSNFDHEESKEKAFELGARDYFVKYKVDIDELRMMMRTYIKGEIR